MSCYEWEAGTIKLPTAEFARVKRAVLVAAIKANERLYDHAQAFWKSLPSGAKSNKDKYNKAARLYVYGNTPGSFDFDGSQPAQQGLLRGTGEDSWNSWQNELYWLLSRMANGDKPRRVKQADLPKPTNRTLSFDVGGESYLSFDPAKKTVRWEVGENNHARDHGRSHSVAKAFFKALDSVKWTRGSGGQIVGNDEYNRDSDYEGGGANYVIDEYGPITRKRRSSRLVYR